jgi:excisionase family DNA binding protein
MNLDIKAECLAALRELLPEIRAAIADAVAKALDEKLLSIEEAAKVTGDTPAALRKRITRGRLPCVRVGSRVRVRLRDLAVPSGDAS